MGALARQIAIPLQLPSQRLIRNPSLRAGGGEPERGLSPMMQQLLLRRPRPVYYNLTGLTKWREAVARVKAGTGRARILCWGDSTEFGYGANRTSNFRYHLGVALAAAGLPISDKSFIGTGGRDKAEYASYDGRIGFGTGNSETPFDPVTVGTTQNVLGGTCVTVSGAMTFTPAGAFDTIEVYYKASSDFPRGNFTVAVDGGAALPNVGTGNTGGASFHINKVVNTVPLGEHTVNIAATSGTALIAGIICYDSTTPAIDICQAGTPSATIAPLSENFVPSNPAPSLPVYGFDLIIPNMLINDVNGGTGIIPYRTGVSSINSFARAAGASVAWRTPPHSDTSAWRAGNHKRNIQTILGFARRDNCAVIDTNADIRSYQRWKAMGMDSDGIHHNSNGYEYLAKHAAIGLINAL
jgi:hypothetical protein